MNTPNLAYCFAGLAFAATWLSALWRLSPTTAWQGDYAVAQRLGAGVTGYEGLVSQALSQVFIAIPLGTIVQRVSLTSALGAAFTAWFACLLAYRVLSSGTQRRSLACWLALGASLLVCLGNTVQSLASVASGPCIAVALGLACVLWMLRVFAPVGSVGKVSRAVAGAAEHAASTPDPTQKSDFFLLGMGVAITTLESHVMGVLLIVMALVLWRWSARSQLGRLPLWAAVGFAAVGAFIATPCYVARRLLHAASIEHTALDSLARLQPFSHFVARQGAWIVQLGPVWFGLSVLGLVLLAVHAERRKYAWLFTLLVLAAMLLPASPEQSRADEGGPVVLGTIALAIAGAMACRFGVEWFTRRKPNAHALWATLTVLAQTVTVLARNEDVHFSTDHYRGLSDEAWADEALAGLPARALVLTKTPALTQRLLVAQQADGARPDVLIVPADRVTDPRMLRLLLGIEPALAPTLRDFAINAKPSENALAGLSDIRPLFVEFDASWDARLREHLLVSPIFHRVYSQTLGRSDRAAALPEGQRAVARLLALTPTGPNTGLTVRNPGDVITRSIVEARLREQLVLLLALGDRQSYETVAADYDQAFPGSAWLKKLRQRATTSTRGAVVALDLLESTLPRTDHASN